MEQTVKVATGSFIVKEGKLLLATGPKFAPHWTVPGGKLAFGEKSDDCVKREAKEEVGVEIETIGEPVYIERVVKISGEPTHFIFINYLCRIYAGEPKIDNRELTAMKWVKIEDVMKDETVNYSVRDSIEKFKKLKML